MPATTTETQPDARTPAGVRLTILYDERCPLCVRARDWLLSQPCLVEVELLAAGSPEARERFGAVPWRGRELVVADDAGHVWVGPGAFMMCMWATARFRGWSYRFAQPAWAPFAERFFLHVSKRRHRWGAWLGAGPRSDCTYCDDVRLRRAP